MKSETSGHPTQWRLPVAAAERGKPLKDYQYGPSGNESTEAPHLETPNRVDPLLPQAEVSVDINLQVMHPQEPVKKTQRVKRVFSPSERKQNAARRKVGVCEKCRKRKERVSFLADWGSSTVANACVVYTCPASRFNGRRISGL